MKDRLQDPNSDFYGFTGGLGNSFSYSTGRAGSGLMNDTSPAKLLERITDLTPNLVIVYNIQTGKYIYINKSLKPLLGYEAADWMRKGVKYVSTKVHPEDLPRIIKENLKAITDDAKSKHHRNNNPIVEFEYRIKNAKGKYRWLKTYGTVFDRDEKGNIKHVINISLDITTIKETEAKLIMLADNLEKKVEQRTKKLKESEATYHSLFSTLTEGVILQDTKGIILAVNPSAAKILNLNPEQMKKNPTNKILTAHYINEDGSLLKPHDYPYVKALKTGEPQKHHVMGIVKDKRTTWILVNSIPLVNESGKPYAIASSFEDITDQKSMEKQKDEFISIASHELKTPLTTIKSFNEILKMQFGKEEKAQYYIGKMHGEIDRLTSLVNELLDVSKIQSGGLTLKKEIVDVDKFVKEVVEDIQTTTPKHKIIYKTKINSKIHMDKHRVYQVLINLISNAIKYSPRGDRVIVSTLEKPDRVIFSIRDFGIGITKKDIRRIFDPFFQANTTIRQSHSGLGLGLHISSEIVKRHGGTISVYSKKGKGSVFRFYLPSGKREIEEN